MSGLTKHLVATDNQARLARYYEKGSITAPDSEAKALLRPDLHPSVAAALGLTPDQKHLTEDHQISCLLAGLRVDGGKIEGKNYAVARHLPVDPRTGERRISHPIGAYDFSPAPDKSVSVAWGLANETEQAIILTAVRDASREAMESVAHEIGRMRHGKAGEGPSERGHAGWIEFQHLTARRTQMVVHDDGTVGFVKKDAEIAGDPDLHEHFLIPNCLVGQETGSVGSLDTGAIAGFIKTEGDGIFHAALARNLHNAGFRVELDEKTGAAILPVIPRDVCDLFSKRTKIGELIAKKGAAVRGEDWESLTKEQRESRIKIAVQSFEQKEKGGKDDDPQFEEWHRQAATIWHVPEQMRERVDGSELRPEDYIRVAYERALPLLDKRFQQKAVLSQWEVRGIAAQGLVATRSMKDRGDIGRVTELMKRDGVLLYGEKTRLIWGRETGQRRVSVTTGLHAKEENEFIRLASAAADDRSGIIPDHLLDSKTSSMDFSGKNGEQQLEAIKRLGQGGRFNMLVAASGAGKTEALKPLVQAWRDQGRRVLGDSLAWRAADALTGAGIHQQNVFAHSVLLSKLNDGSLVLNKSDVLAVDEWSMIGTRSGLDLLRHQSRHGFTIIALGDDKQIGAVAQAGDIVDLSRRALGSEVIPEISTTRRQETEREQEIAGHLRARRAAQALAMKREDKTADMADGSDAVVSRALEVYRQKLKESERPPIVLAPTNAEAHMLAEAVRDVRRKEGLLGADVRTVRATDGSRQYSMPLAIGDRLRLLRTTGARYAEGHGGTIGRNGSIVEIVGIDQGGLMVRANTGKVGYVSWDRMKDKDSGRFLATYGYSHTIHSAQGSSDGDGILTLPDGSRSIDAERGYSGLTRHRFSMHIITNARAETAEVRRRRPINDLRPITDDDRWAQVARALSREPDRDTATALLERLEEAQHGTVAGEPQRHRRQPRKVEERQAAPIVQAVVEAARSQQEAVAEVVEQARPQAVLELLVRDFVSGEESAWTYEDLVQFAYLRQVEEAKANAQPDHHQLLHGTDGIDYGALHDKASDEVAAAIDLAEAELDKQEQAREADRDEGHER